MVRGEAEAAAAVTMQEESSVRMHQDQRGYKYSGKTRVFKDVTSLLANYLLVLILLIV